MASSENRIGVGKMRKEEGGAVILSIIRAMKALRTFILLDDELVKAIIRRSDLIRWDDRWITTTDLDKPWADLLDDIEDLK